MTEEKPNPIKEAQIAAKKAAAELKAKRDALKLNIGKSFTGERDCKVVGFEAGKSLGPIVADAFLVNFGNPNRSDYIFCDEFLTNYKGKE